jgi:branched-chain amino acid transport system permease protein
MVMFAPGGLASLVMVHAPVWRARLLSRLVPSYALAALALAVLFAGGVALVEMIYHMEGDSDKAFRLFGVSVEATRSMPWVVAALVFVAGIVLFALALRPVRRAWQDVNGELVQRGGA